MNLGNLKDDLDRQIQDRQQKKLVAYEEFLQEKKQVDEIVRRVHDQERLSVTTTADMPESGVLTTRFGLGKRKKRPRSVPNFARCSTSTRWRGAR